MMPEHHEQYADEAVDADNQRTRVLPIGSDMFAVDEWAGHPEQGDPWVRTLYLSRDEALTLIADLSRAMRSH